MLRLTLSLSLLLGLAACGDDMIVDPSTSAESTAGPTATTDLPTTTGGGPFPSTDPTFTTTDDPTTTTTPPTTSPTSTTDTTTDTPDTDTTDTDGDLCGGAEFLTEAEFPGKMATRVCAQRSACGCASPTCTVDVAAALSDMSTWSKSQMLEYDDLCAAFLYNRAQTVACDDQITAAEQGCAPCQVYRGFLAPGNACELNQYGLYATQCGTGLACGPNAECAVTELPLVGAGDQCFTGTTIIARCPEFTLCNASGNGLCVPAPAPGEPCFNGTACSIGQFCDDAGLCQLQRPPGEPCDSPLQCHSLECTQNVCTSTPWICRPPWSAGA